MAQVNIDVAKESSVSSLSTTLGSINSKIDTLDSVADNIYAKVDTEVASVVTNTATNNTASKTGTLSQKESYTIELLENTTYGLNAIKTALGSSSSGVVKSVQRGTATNTSSSTTVNITISSVDINKTIVLLSGSGSTGATYAVATGCSSSKSYTNAIAKDPYISALTATKLTVIIPGNNKRPTSSSANYETHTISWQVIEFY